jgi:alpha,alpha-trehalose phosphorylase
VEINSDVAVTQGIRFSMFHIYQSTGKDGITNISANGLTGTGYSGHTFWDTEIFMMPMYIYTAPEIAKQLIMYRYNILPNAKKRAKEMDDVGALFSWNSINGEECGHVFEAVTAQYHINNAVFYAIKQYYEATDDIDFMVNYCAEILFEISKCLSHRGNFIPLKGNKFCINCICGPDEYNPIVDNNLYTNLMTKKMFDFTLEIKELLEKNYTEKYNELLIKTEMNDEEFARIKLASENMYLAYSNELDIYMQDDNFFYKDPIDIENIPLNKLPLLTNLHPLNLWRYQVCKQADIILLMFLQSQEFTPEMRKKVFDFYEPKTELV